MKEPFANLINDRPAPHGVYDNLRLHVTGVVMSFFTSLRSAAVPHRGSCAHRKALTVLPNSPRLRTPNLRILRRRISALLVPAALAHAAFAQPRIEVERSLWDFGAATNLAELRHEFVIRNQGDVELEIFRVVSGCDPCLRVSLDKKKISPGGSAPLHSRLNLRGLSGRISRTISIDCNDPRNPSVALGLIGTVVADASDQPALTKGFPRNNPPDLEIVPERLWFRVQAEPQTRILWLRQTSAAPWLLLDAIPPSDKMHCSIEPEPGGVNYRIYVTAWQQEALGGRTNMLVLRLRDQQQRERSVPVPLSIDSKGPTS